MYEAFYGLSEKPFNLTPDPRFLFLSEKHKEAFAHLLYGIKNRTGFIMVSGEVGTGKTTICRSLLNQLDPDIEVAFIFNPFLSPEELLSKINEDFGILSQGRTVKELIDELNEYLLDRNGRGKNCVLVIDEAQDLSPTVLEQIRLLSNLETETQKLLQIVLIGQPELAQNLQLPELRQLNQRITARYHLRALDRTETMQYIAYRLNAAGARGQVRFKPRALRAVYKASGGTPRVVNAICDRALLIGYTRELRDITGGLIREAAREIRGASLKRRPDVWPAVLKYLLPSGTVVATAGALMMLAKLIGPFEPPPARVLPVAQAITPAAAVVEHARTAPVQPPPAQTQSDVKPHEQPALQTLAERLAAVDPGVARNAGLAGIMSAWNMAVVAGFPDGDAPSALAAYGHSNGLASETLTPALDQLIAIDLPALARMKAGDEMRWVALTGVNGGNFRITLDGYGTVEVPRDEFREHYANQAIIFWRDPEPYAPVLRRETRGAAVADLKRQLRTMSRLTGPDTPVYDERTARAVARLQAETGIHVDGIAGKQVRMVLSSWVPGQGTPSLTDKEKPPATQTIAEDQPKQKQPRPQTAEKQEEHAAKAKEPVPNIEAVPILPAGAMPVDEFNGGHSRARADDRPSTDVQAPADGAGGMPPIPRMPGLSAPVAVDSRPAAAGGLSDELNS